MVKHQQNYLRLQELRQTSNSLDETIKTTIRLLADTRKDIASIPATDSSTDRRDVDIQELLTYAKYIAPTTVPPTYRKSPKYDSQSQSNVVESTAGSAGHTTQISNGLSTPPPQATTTAEDHNPAFIKSENIGLTTMEERDKAWLLPDPDVFQPWPTQDVMNSGALGDIQRMIERGEDPSTKLSKQEQAEADLKREAEEEANRQRKAEEERRAKEMFGAGTMQRRGTIVEAFNPDDL